jgi:hypothetical protein
MVALEGSVARNLSRIDVGGGGYAKNGAGPITAPVPGGSTPEFDALPATASRRAYAEVLKRPTLATYRQHEAVMTAAHRQMALICIQEERPRRRAKRA